MSVAFDIAIEYRDDGMAIGPMFDMMVPIFGLHQSLEAIVGTMGLDNDRERQLIAWFEAEPGDSQEINVEELLQVDLPTDDEEEMIQFSLDNQVVPDRPANVRLPAVTSETRAGKCMICLDDTLTSPVELNCGHSFCHGCIKTWFQTRDSCPCCRRIAKPVRAPTKRRRRRRVQRPPRAGRRRPRCRNCGALRSGHSRRVCQGPSVAV